MHRLLFLLCFLLSGSMFAVTITGTVTDAGTLQQVANVSVSNIHTNAGTLSDAGGRFTIEVASGQLLEFRKLGYKTLRVRIPDGDIPVYFKVLMQQGPIELPEYNLQTMAKDWKRDSIRFYELYKGALNFPKLEGLDMIRHPFSALSKHNRQIWAFQKEYNYWEQQKYIDYTFNEKLVHNITGLQGDSLQVYLKRFRPSYEYLRNMNEYTFYSYIKESAIFFRTGKRNYRPVITRSSN